MSPDRKSNFSIILAFLAVLIGGLTLYETHLRSIDLTMTLGRWAYISNTYGASPDLYIGLALSVEGPSSRSLSILELKGTLTRVDGTDAQQEVSLVNSSRAGLPTVINGGEVVNLPRVLLARADSASSLIERYTKWCKDLHAAFPQRTEEVNKIEKALMTPYFRDTTVENATQEQSDQKQSIEELIRKLTPDEDVDELIADLLKDGEARRLKEVIFFRAGIYELKIEAIDENSTARATETRRFSIDEIGSQVLLHQFNSNDLRFDLNLHANE